MLLRVDAVFSGYLEKLVVGQEKTVLHRGSD